MDTKRKATQRSSEEMFSLITGWKTSGISQLDFCKQHQVPYSVFQYWVKKFKELSSDTDSGFIEVKLTPPVSSPTEVEIVFPSGAKVVFKSQPEPSFIRSLVG